MVCIVLLEVVCVHFDVYIYCSYKEASEAILECIETVENGQAPVSVCGCVCMCV